MADQPNWRDPKIAADYLNSVRNNYLAKPGIKITLQLVLSVFAVAFFTFFAIRPTLSTISELLKKIDDQKKVDTQLDTKISQLEDAQQELITNESFLPLITLAVPQTPDLEGFARRLEVLAVEESAELNSLQFQSIPLVGDRTSLAPQNAAAQNAPPSKQPGNLFITFDFILNGNQASILSFLRKLETIDRAVAITKVSFTKPPLQQQKFYQLTATGRGTIYYQPKTNR